MGLYVGVESAQFEQEVGGKTAQRWARLPETVLCDSQLTPASRLVFAFLAMHVFDGSKVQIGQRFIAKRLGLHKETVMYAVRELESKGHLEIRGDGRVRRTYRLASKVFGTAANGALSEQKTAQSPTNTGIEPRRRIECPTCPGKPKRLHKTGRCYACIRKESQERAYREAMAELPAGSSHDEISARVELNRASKRLLPVGRKLRVA